MSKFEVLCVTMHQSDFSKIEEMNIHSDVVFANQCDRTSYEKIEFEGHTAKMISTSTRGVGVNRNLALTYASADICLFADDDVKYVDNMEELVLREFNANPDADVFIFHFETNSIRKQKKYSKTRKCGLFEKMPWGGFRIAVRLTSLRRANVWFTTLFGGGCIFPSGEDSIWLLDAKRKGLKFYVSKETIGTVSFEKSSWFDGYNEKFYYSKGVFYSASHSKTRFFWSLYFALRTYKLGNMRFREKMKWMKNGGIGYRKMLSYDDFKQLTE